MWLMHSEGERLFKLFILFNSWTDFKNVKDFRFERQQIKTQKYKLENNINKIYWPFFISLNHIFFESHYAPRFFVFLQKLKITRWVALMIQLDVRMRTPRAQEFVVVGGVGWVAVTNYLYPARWGWINMQNKIQTDKPGDFKSLQSFIEHPPGCPQWSRARRVHIWRWVHLRTTPRYPMELSQESSLISFSSH